MFRRLPLLLGLLLALAPVATRGADAWARLKLGMTADETTAVLGAPLIRTAGHGFELWTYDNGAEALLFGSLIGWTASGSASVAERSFDIWRARRADSSSPSFLGMLPRTNVTSTTKRRNGPAAAPSEREWLPLYFRRSH